MPPALPNPFDHATRGMLRRAEATLLPYLTLAPTSSVQFVRWIDTRLAVPRQPERVCDTVAHVQRTDLGGRPWAVPVEFQVAPDPLMFGRALVYQGMIWLQEKPTDLPGDRFELIFVVVNLTGVGRCSRDSAWLPGLGTSLRVAEWNLETLDAFAALAAVEQMRAPLALLALISLMKNGDDPYILGRWRVLAERETDPQRRADLALVVLFADLTGRTAVWKKALEGFDVIKSPTADAWAAEGKAGALVAILEDKFGAVPDEVRAKIDAAEALDVLQRWVVLAARADCLDEFRQAAGI